MILYIFFILLFIFSIVMLTLISKYIIDGKSISGLSVVLLTCSLVVLTFLSLSIYDHSIKWQDNNANNKEKYEILIYKLENPDKFNIDDTIDEIKSFNSMYDRAFKYDHNPWIGLYWNAKEYDDIERIDLSNYIKKVEEEDKI